ncbi:nitroreductase family protein [Methanobrevibacter sp.]|uniref:nitroreductase family protein n=1 Tax=Methanobrevibacter sp. TaxID=66852 RepID=UPI0038901A59
MNLEEQIYLRKSCRKYLDDEIDMDSIHKFLSSVKPLNDDINYYYKILTRDEVNLRTRWSAPYYLALFSEKKENYLTNIGFVFQQVSLYLQSVGIGSCWVGLASLKEKSSEFVIVISFGRSENMTRDISDFKRKQLSEISDFADERLTPARLAPSAVNSQPWYFKHSDDEFDVYQVKQNFVKRQFLKKWNPIDVGIALAHMYVANEKTFEFYRKSDFEEIKGYTYIGSIKI